MTPDAGPPVPLSTPGLESGSEYSTRTRHMSLISATKSLARHGVWVGTRAGSRTLHATLWAVFW